MIFGKEKIAKILSRLGMPDSGKVLDAIAAHNGQLAEEIRELMFSFEDLSELTERDMLLLHKKIDQNDLLLAMKGAGDELKEKLLTGISSKKRVLLTEEMELMGKVRRSDVEAARRRITDLVYELIERGEISLDDEWIE
ncbi:MAG: FliG C-terminal domain-containing protein [Sulfurimonadaceae bacterium]|nr:FliG C-terminal domain-containing protein [Sulfurimonadaceae bacterium]